MSNTSRALSWLSRWRAEPARESTDWADLGTAYGLDQSMQAPATEAAPSTFVDLASVASSARIRGWPRCKPKLDSSAR